MGNEMYSAPGLVTRMQFWISGGSASILVQSSRLQLDPSCDTLLDTLKAHDCPLGSSSPRPVVPTEAPPSNKNPIVGGGSNAGAIGGIIIGVVVAVLFAIFIILLVLVIMNKWKPRRYCYE